MILQRPLSQHIGKILTDIEQDTGNDDLVMCKRVRFTFDDGSHIELRLDWRGDSAYISEYIETAIP